MEEVLELRKAGRLLRGIVDDINLGLSTVRTIVGKANGTAGGRPLNPRNEPPFAARMAESVQLSENMPKRRKTNSD